ncbi:MarR family transcriptional regulator [Weissella cibaria]|uniref:AdcR protein n=1 Tax=Weissella cibaria TaxID=137591 RepID=A0A0D1LW91_9LACO|nr:MarR family transcriptional regulator [Weissella cibaria]ALI32469.1 MarR family transcriptional regulator [Weissella cibaria]AWF96623.1 Transcriptional regulator ZitR [Weissella cibaria]KIU22706.1 Transcriptional repressor AdcR [Weissella cibaria]KIU24060.1 Transcriptional repressor AdcR [Weissella cibaria]MBD1501416.1 MarR family transcriptional regulator [Weissella cibaria]
MATEEYAEQLDHFLNDVRVMAENQREILLGESNSAITTTQGHVLMLLAQNGPQTNSELARALGVSGAAITKAMKGLAGEEDPMVNAIPDPDDGRVSRWSLTGLGISMASAHAQRHRETLAEYQNVFAVFTESDQTAISHFLTLVADRLHGDTDN